MFVQAGFPRSSSPISEDRNFSLGGEVVGNPGPEMELPWGLVSIGVIVVPVSQIWRGLVVIALGGLQYQYQ